MGLFGSRKKAKNVPVTSVTERSQNPEEIKEEVLQSSYDEINEHAEVVERTSEHEEAAEETDPEMESTSPEDGVEAEDEDDDDIRTFIPFRDKPKVAHAIGQTKILAIINQKGGVGKSTTAVNLSAALGAMGKEVLLVDLDPQGNATSGYGIDKRALDGCVYNVLLGETPVEEVILSCVAEGVDVLPSTISLAGAEVELVNEMARENRLKSALGSLRGRYDYILIDCPPSLGLLTINALVAADKLLVPIQCEFYALEGLSQLINTVNIVGKRLNPSLSMEGVVLTMYDPRTNLSQQVVGEVKRFFNNRVYETMIPRNVRLGEAPSFGLPITLYDPNCSGAKAYLALAQEVIDANGGNE